MKSSDELDLIRAQIERSHLTVNEGDTTADLVARLIQLSWPDNATATWFKRWQIASQMNNALRVSLVEILTALDEGKAVTREQVDEAWKVLADVQTLTTPPEAFRGDSA